MPRMGKAVRNEEWGPYTSTRRVDVNALPPVRDAGAVTGALDELLRRFPEAELKRALSRLSRQRPGPSSGAPSGR